DRRQDRQPCRPFGPRGSRPPWRGRKAAHMSPRISLPIGPPIRKYMTHAPHTIGREQTLTAAHRMMRDHRVRHLPVLEAGKLIGILTQRDLHLIETLRDVDPDTTTVDEAMTMDVYVTDPSTPLEEVAARTADHKYRSAILL